MRRFLLYAVGTFLGTGFAPVAPASVASLAVALLWWWAAPVPVGVHLLLLVTVTAVGVPVAAALARRTGRVDPSLVVIDEVAGMLVTYLGVPAGGAGWLVGFFWFRVFDILKPLGVRRLERVGSVGVGIMLDDLGAGVLACLATHVTLAALGW
ncbi:MAG: phosphatidylglycerophosphatase A [Candidatus Krumholzibacteriia bacterium]